VLRAPFYQVVSLIVHLWSKDFKNGWLTREYPQTYLSKRSNWTFYFPHALVRTPKYSKPTGATQSCSSERRYVLAQYSDARNRTQQTSRNIFRVIYFSEGNGWMRRSEKGLDPPLAPRPKLGQLSSLEGEGMALDVIRCSSKRSREATLPLSPLLASWSGPTLHKPTYTIQRTPWTMFWTMVKPQRTALRRCFLEMYEFRG